VILFAMTNEPWDNCKGRYKDLSSNEYVIAVSRSTNRDQYDRAGYGACMELLAPTASADGSGPGVVTTDIMGRYGYTSTNYFNDFGGTSSATPLVAGVVGLMLSVNPDLTREQVTSILLRTADKIDGAQARYNNQGFSNTHGYGRVNALKAVTAARR
jgi:subtilisin family serine protease